MKPTTKPIGRAQEGIDSRRARYPPPAIRSKAASRASGRRPRYDRPRAQGVAGRLAGVEGVAVASLSGPVGSNYVVRAVVRTPQKSGHITAASHPPLNPGAVQSPAERYVRCRRPRLQSLKNCLSVSTSPVGTGTSSSTKRARESSMSANIAVSKPGSVLAARSSRRSVP